MLVYLSVLILIVPFKQQTFKSLQLRQNILDPFLNISAVMYLNYSEH